MRFEQLRALGGAGGPGAGNEPGATGPFDQLVEVDGPHRGPGRREPGDRVVGGIGFAGSEDVAQP